MQTILMVHMAKVEEYKADGNGIIMPDLYMCDEDLLRLAPAAAERKVLKEGEEPSLADGEIESVANRRAAAELNVKHRAEAKAKRAADEKLFAEREAEAAKARVVPVPEGAPPLDPNAQEAVPPPMEGPAEPPAMKAIPEGLTPEDMSALNQARAAEFDASTKLEAEAKIAADKIKFAEEKIAMDKAHEVHLAEQQAALAAFAEANPEKNQGAAPAPAEKV